MFLSNTSACNGCAFGERISCGVFCSEIKELVPVGYQGCKAQDEFYEKMYQEEKIMTLTELAKNPNKVIKIRWITVGNYLNKGHEILNFWLHKPKFNRFANIWEKGVLVKEIETSELDFDLNLSEYKDEQGNIDYSKCIVEVD